MPPNMQNQPVDPALIVQEDSRVLLRNRYIVRRKLGRGSQGRVYEAYDRSRNSNVALKIVDDRNEDPQIHARLKLEYNTLKSADKRVRLLEVYDLREERTGSVKYTWFTMELCRSALSSLLATIPLRGRIDVARHVLSALAYLHNLNISHRDIKPANLLLTFSDELRIGDFGTVRSLNGTPVGNIVDVHYLVGTQNYMAPELWRCLEQSRLREQDLLQADQYAAGITLYQILSAGHLPPQLRGVADQVSARRAHESGIVAPLEIPERPGCRFEAVDAVLRRMLCPDPDGRFSSIGRCSIELLAALVHDGLGHD